jgi:hypothetical protein
LFVVLLRKERKKNPNGGRYSTATTFRWWAISMAVVTVVLAFPVGICSFLSVDQIKTQAVSQETALDAQYVQNQNVLSTYVTSYEEQLGIANLQSSKIQGIITSAVAGQSNLKDLLDPGKSPLYSALAEAYPNVTLAQYQQLMQYIQDGRNAFQASQSQLLQMLGQFDSWRDSGFIFHPWLVSLSGAPNSNLHVIVGNKTLTGSAAEAQMWQIVRNPTAVASINSGLASPLPTK